MAILVSLIGLSAIAVGRVTLRVASVGSDGGDAELLALSAIEHAAATINTDSAWRSHYSNATPISPIALGRGTFTWRLVDEADGNLSSGGLQPVRIWGVGNVGEASRCYSVVFTPGGTNLAINPGTESGTTGYAVQGADCVLQSLSDDPHNGALYLLVKQRAGATAGPQQDLTGSIIKDASYYIEVWVKMTTASDDPWLSFVLKKSGQTDIPFRVRGQTATSSAWTRVSGTLTPTWSTTPDTVVFRIETNSTAQDFKIDDLKIVQSTSATPMAPVAESWHQETPP
jgi:hypothetical protein